VSKKDWVELTSGVRLNVPEPQPGAFVIRIIAYGLAGEYRFSGQTYPRLTVAEHCVRCAEAAAEIYARLPAEEVKRLQVLALLHDAPEGVCLRDIATPIKRLLVGYKDLEQRWYLAILRDLGVARPSEAEDRKIKYVDSLMLITEAARLGMSYQDYGLYAEGFRPLEWMQRRIQCHFPLAAEALYMNKWWELMGTPAKEVRLDDSKHAR